jgi:MFS transporter, SET family, sugar efflux transporter
MFHSLRQIFAQPQLALLAVMIFVHGSAIGSTLPYLSVTAINELGLSDQAYSLVVFAASLAAVTIGVSMGILSDIIGDRRKMILAMALTGAAGYSAVFFFPSAPVFVLATVFVVPFFQALSSLLFAGARARTAGFPGREAASVNATMRSFTSAAWVVMPAAMGFALAGSRSMLGAWGVAGLCAFLIFLASLFLMQKSAIAAAAERSGPGFLASLKEIASPLMLARMLSMASLTGTIRLSSTLWPLIVTVNLGGTTADVGVIAGLIALLEVPFMLIWAALLKRAGILAILIAAGLIYAAYMAALTFAAAGWQIYALTIPGAAGAAALLSMPLSYFQDLFPGRPGLGTSLYPINSFLGNALTALAFAAGAHYFGYSGAAWLGVLMVFAGIAGLLAVERRWSAMAPD